MIGFGSYVHYHTLKIYRVIFVSKYIFGFETSKICMWNPINVNSEMINMTLSFFNQTWEVPNPMYLTCVWNLPKLWYNCELGESFIKKCRFCQNHNDNILRCKNGESIIDLNIILFHVSIDICYVWYHNMCARITVETRKKLVFKKSQWVHDSDTSTMIPHIDTKYSRSLIESL